MDDKSSVDLNGYGDELMRLRLENQGLRALLERIRGQRDDAEDRFANSQTKVAQLERQVRKHAWRISDLEAENRVVREVPRDVGPPVCYPALNTRYLSQKLINNSFY